jgi:hypothetical protein
MKVWYYENGYENLFVLDPPDQVNWSDEDADLVDVPDDLFARFVAARRAYHETMNEVRAHLGRDLVDYSTWE